MIDLEAIKKHRALWEPDDCTSLPTICEHVDDLVAEVDRLREMLLNAGWPREAEGIAELAQQAERAAVVAWLREKLRENEGYVRPVAWEILSAAADCIESGRHRREED
jgi:hypothetical protein